MKLYPKIDILVADRHELIRIGLRAVIDSHRDLRIVAETDSFNQTLQLASRLKPNVILFDAQLNDGDFLDQIPLLFELSPQSKILFFTCNAQEEIHLHALRLGVAGIVPKYQSSALLIKAIQAVNAGQLWFDRNITQLVLQSQHNPSPKQASVVSTLNSRECRIACMSSKGWSAKKIAAAVALSEKTVRNQLTLIYDKLNVQGQVALCLQYSSKDFCDSGNSPCDRDKCPEN